MRIKLHRKERLNITFVDGEQLKLEPRFYLYIETEMTEQHKNKPVYIVYVKGYISNVVNEFNERGFFMADQQVLTRLLSNKKLTIF